MRRHALDCGIDDVDDPYPVGVVASDEMAARFAHPYYVAPVLECKRGHQLKTQE